MRTGERIKQRRIELGYTVDQLAKILNKNRATIYRYENGDIENLPTSILTPLAKALNTTPADLVGWSDTISRTSTAPIIPEEGFIPKYKKVPLLGTTAAGEPIYSEEHFEEYIDVHEKYNIDYCLRVQGDSMIGANIFDGDIVFVRKQSIVENGEIAVVRVNDTVTLKRFYKTDTGVMLQSENPKYAPLLFNSNNTDSFIILGKAVILQTTVK